MQIKIKQDPKKLCKGLPVQFQQFLEETKKLNFEDKPNYVYFKQLLLEIIEKESKKIKLGEHKYFDWEIKFEIDKSSVHYLYDYSLTHDNNLKMNPNEVSPSKIKIVTVTDESYPQQSTANASNYDSECNIKDGSAKEYSFKFYCYPDQQPKRQLLSAVNVQQYDYDSQMQSYERTNDDQIHSIKIFDKDHMELNQEENKQDKNGN